jgi:hypothetical protein
MSGVAQNALPAETQAFTVDEFAEAFRLSRATVYNLWRDGAGPAKISRRRRQMAPAGRSATGGRMMGAHVKTPGAGGRSGARTNTYADTAKDTVDGRGYQALPRCIACRTPVSRSHHTLCRACWKWQLAGLHLRGYVSLTRLVDGVRK